MTVTKSWLTNYIKTRSRIQAKAMVGRALWRLWQRQTADEQATKTTKHKNGRGFNAFDAKSGSAAGQYYLRNGTLTNEIFNKWIAPRGRHGFPKICRYSRQLSEISEEEAKARAKTQ